MTNFKNSISMIVLSVLMSLTISMTAFSHSKESHMSPFFSEVEMTKLLELDADFSEIENELREEGVLACENTETIIILGEDDKVLYRGSLQLEDQNNAFLTRLLTKADFLMSSGGEYYYKVF